MHFLCFEIMKHVPLYFIVYDVTSGKLGITFYYVLFYSDMALSRVRIVDMASLEIRIVDMVFSWIRIVDVVLSQVRIVDTVISQIRIVDTVLS